MIRVFKTDFKDINEERMKVSQDDIPFLKKMKENIYKHAWTLFYSTK